jgi:hypothetical protein
MGVRYTNRAITTEQQIDILKERGLLIDDVERAVKALDIISYFRLAGYWRHFEADHTTHQFREGCRFADIIDLYSFDKQLRALLFTAIQTIEVAVRTKIIKHFALEFGAFWFMDENFATNEARFATNLAVIRKEVERSHDDFITEHFRKYNEPELPPHPEDRLSGRMAGFQGPCVPYHTFLDHPLQDAALQGHRGLGIQPFVPKGDLQDGLWDVDGPTATDHV